jgi:hypothetical protein
MCVGSRNVIVFSSKTQSVKSTPNALTRKPTTIRTTPHCWVLFFFCNLYLQFIAPINLWNKCFDLRLFSKYLRVPFLRSLRSPRSNNLETQNDENSKWKLVKTRWNPKFGLSDLENDLLTSTTSKGAQGIFPKNTSLKSVHQAEKNEL